MKVFVYFNLHKKLWSVKALEGPNKGKVIKHVFEIFLKDCEFRVQKAGRRKVLAEKRKNVHAGVVGYECEPRHFLPLVEVTYNPYKYETFVDKHTEAEMRHSPYVWMWRKQVFADYHSAQVQGF